MPKAITQEALLQSIIDEVTKGVRRRKSNTGTPTQQPSTPAAGAAGAAKEVAKVDNVEKTDKWRLLPLDKQMKLYENTVSFCNIFPVYPRPARV